MSSDDELWRLRAEGYSIRAIADATGLSKSMVHRMLNADADDDPDLDLSADDLDEIALFDATDDDDYPPPGPFTDVGTVRGVGGMKDETRYLDGNGRPCSALDVYRRLMLMENVLDDYAGADAIRASLGW